MVRGIDLFCGGGAGSWGAKNAGVEMVGAVDAWDIATRTYADNFSSAKRNVVNKPLDDDSGPDMFDRIGSVDLIIASPECTHHSIARGARPRDEESRRSGWYVMGFVDVLRPRWVVLENVTSMLGWPGFENLISRLKALNYRVIIQRLDASDVGVPQNRRRLFIICDRYRQPDEVRGESTLPTEARTILDPFGTWAARDIATKSRAGATMERIATGMHALGHGKDFLIVYYGSDRAGGWQTLDRPLRTLTTLDRFGVVQWLGDRPTLRMLQVPELKRGIGLPDRFRLDHGTRRDKVKLLGNGVCAPVMRKVVSTLLRGELKAVAAE